MAHSINFNEIDMSTYKLIVITPGVNLLRQLVSHIQLQDRGYAFRPVREPRCITVECAVTGTSRANLDVNLDVIRRTLTLLVPKKLIFDALSGRYFNAILGSFVGGYRGTTQFEGVIDFICPDPLGYKITPTDHDHDIDANPKTVDEAVAGTGYVAPVYTLTAKNALTEATIKVENLTTEEELIWVGDLAIDDDLVIDVENWIVKKNVTASMATVTGKFPRLKPNATNQIKVTGLFVTVTGNLNITYRETYL